LSSLVTAGCFLWKLPENLFNYKEIAVSSTAMTHTYWTHMGKLPAREGGFLSHAVFA